MARAPNSAPDYDKAAEFGVARRERERVTELLRDIVVSLDRVGRLSEIAQLQFSAYDTLGGLRTLDLMTEEMRFVVKQRKFLTEDQARLVDGFVQKAE